MARPKKPRKTLGKPLPDAFGEELRRALLPMIRQAQATAATVRTPEQARGLKAALRRAWSDERLRELVAKIGRKAERSSSAPWGRMDAEKRPTYNGEKLVDGWSKAAAALITSLRDEVAEGVRQDVVETLERGLDPADLASRWKTRGLPVEWGTLEGRVQVIARHQLSILHTQVQRTRAEAVGVEEFVWRTQGDDRVRDAHAALDGQVFRYDDPPPEGLPGEPINCRCYAESVIPDEVLGEFGVSGTLSSSRRR